MMMPSTVDKEMRRDAAPACQRAGTVVNACKRLILWRLNYSVKREFVLLCNNITDFAAAVKCTGEVFVSESFRYSLLRSPSKLYCKDGRRQRSRSSHSRRHSLYLRT